MMAFRLSLWLVALALVAGCAPSVAKKGSALQLVSQPAGEYRIQPGDQLDVKFFYNPELNEQLTVRSDGRITLQLVNDVLAAGLTPAELTAALTKAYASELANPKVAVIVRSTTDKVYVDGEVNRAGVFNLTGPTTVLQSIAQAGGLKESARAHEVLVLRKGENNRIAAIKVNLEEQDLVVRPNDIVYVPRTAIGDVDLFVDQYIRKLIPLPIGLGYSL